MGSKTFEYRDFSGGDWGRTEPWRAPKNTFSATNMLVYRTGEIGVRTGVRNVTPAGVANGVVQGLGRMPSSLSTVFYAQGTAVKYFDPVEGGTLSTATGAFTGAGPTARTHMDDAGNTVYIATTTVNGYSLTGSTLTSLNNMPNAQAIALYGQRLAVVPTATPNSIVFSADSSFNNWTISAGNAVSVTIGDSDPIKAIFAQRTHLAVLKQNSGLYILTGTPGTSETVRLASRLEGPLASWQAGRTRSDDRIWFATTNAQPMAMFDGTNVSWYDNYPLSLFSQFAARTVMPLRYDDQTGAAFIVEANAGVGTANEVWLHHRGMWTRHTFGVGITAQAASCGVGFPQDGGTDPSRIRYGSQLVFTDGGAVGAPPAFWSWLPCPDRPGLEASPFAQSAERAGDASSTPVTGTLTLPEQRSEDGHEIQVRGVIVDFRSWQTGGASNNHFDLAVNTLNSYESPTPVSSATAAFDEAPSLSSLAGSVRSKYFSFGDQGRGSAFNLSLTNIRGVAFTRFRIVTETYPARVG